MGILKKLTSEYFGETERKEDIIELPEGVERVDFTDRNGVRHRRGYMVADGYRDILAELIGRLISMRGPECDLNDIYVSNVEYMVNWSCRWKRTSNGQFEIFQIVHLQMILGTDI